MKSVITFLCLTIIILSCPAQNDAGKLDDWSRININIFIPEDSVLIDIPLKVSEYNSISRTLDNKLRSFVARNGFSGLNRSPRFMLFPSLILLESTYTTTAPVMVVQNFEISLYVADFMDKKTFDVVTFNIQGAGRTKEQAMRKALNQMRYDPQIEQFLNNSKQQILTYYNDQCDFIMQEVEMLASTGRYEDAFHVLLQVPQASKNCYEEAIKRLPEYHEIWAKERCQNLLHQAKVAWASKSKTSVFKREAAAKVGNEKDEISDKYKKQEDDSGVAEINSSVNAKETNKHIYEALIHIEAITPNSECYEEASQLLVEIKAYVDDEEFFENRKKYQDQHEIELQRLRDATLSKELELDRREKQNSTASGISKQ